LGPALLYQRKGLIYLSFNFNDLSKQVIHLERNKEEDKQNETEKIMEQKEEETADV